MISFCNRSFFKIRKTKISLFPDRSFLLFFWIQKMFLKIYMATLASDAPLSTSVFELSGSSPALSSCSIKSSSSPSTWSSARISSRSPRDPSEPCWPRSRPAHASAGFDSGANHGNGHSGCSNSSAIWEKKGTEKGYRPFHYRLHYFLRVCQ